MTSGHLQGATGWFRAAARGNNELPFVVLVARGARAVPRRAEQTALVNTSAIAQIGVTGFAVMGRDLARSLAGHGHTVAVHTEIDAGS